ncbi:MAG TPA: LysR family transcriptional regulator [Firmicutes bacterium]|nr:LysR family transcriptional regulator [Candidatus Fermentithermobacillaceae bacterium]
MTITQIKFVIEASRAGSINRAAANLFISQSVLSASIKRLEDELGRQIFIRTNKGVRLTRFGQDFVSYVTPIAMQVDQIHAMLARSSDKHSVVFRVASSGFFFLSDIFKQLYDKYKAMGIRINTYEGSIGEVTRLVRDQVAEVGIVRRWSCYRNAHTSQLHALRLRFYPIAALNVGITVGPNNPLFHQESNYVTPDMIKGYPAIMYGYMDDGPYADIFDRLKLPASSNKIVTTSRAVVYEMLALTDAYYLNSLYHKDPSQVVIRDFRSPQRTLLLKDCDIKSEIGWIKIEESDLSRIAAEAVEMIADHIISRICV